MQIRGDDTELAIATPRFPLEPHSTHQPAQQGLHAGVDSSCRYDGPSPAGDHCVGFNAKMCIK
jgi:hypothetical protein